MLSMGIFITRLALIIVYSELLFLAAFCKYQKFMSNNLTALDLFAGAGGLSLGFEKADFKVPIAVEVDDWAADTYENNRKDLKVLRTDIKEISDHYFGQMTGLDVVMGGPPCQGFSISAGNRRKLDDPRNALYRHFLRAVRLTKPRIVLMENVKGILTARNQEGDLILDDIRSTLINLGYNVSYGLVNAVTFGVPQDRIRFFLIAGLDASFRSALDPNLYFQNSPLFGKDSFQISLWDSISDLPTVVPKEIEENSIFQYEMGPQNEYQRKLRRSSDTIWNHVPMRHTQRVIDRFKLIEIGRNQTSVPIVNGPRKRSAPNDLSGVIYDQNHRRLNPYKPSPTITASFYSSFIHPFEHRNLTVREAARIQSFPDTYKFYGKRTTLSKKLLARKGIFEDIHLDQFNQVGNAVPPLLAETLARRIFNLIKEVTSNAN